jgi:hypothetical protein
VCKIDLLLLRQAHLKTREFGMDGVEFCPFCEWLLLSRFSGRMADADVGSVQSADMGSAFADVGSVNFSNDRL